MEKSKTLQTSKSYENSAPPNQLYNDCYRNFSRQETQEKRKKRGREEERHTKGNPK